MRRRKASSGEARTEDQKIADRRGAIAKQKRRRKWRMARAGAILVLIAIAVAALLRSAPASVQVVNVNGETRLPEDQIARVANLAGAPLVALDSAAAARRVKGIPQILDCQVHVDYLRRTVDVDVTERSPSAYAVSGRDFLLVDQTGVGLEMTSTPPSGLVGLTGEIGPPGVGKESEAAGSAIATAVELSNWTLSAFRFAGYGVRGATLTSVDGSIVYAGRPERLAEKGRVLRAMQADARAGRVSIAAYDVSSPDAPAATPVAE